MDTQEENVIQSAENNPERTVLLERFGISGYEEMQELRRFYEASVAEAERQPDNQEAARNKEIAGLRLELFRREHDNAGAYKFNRFGREMLACFEPVEGGAAEILLDDEGQIVLSERLSKRRMITANMGELDRFNLEGGHRAGDAGLSATARDIEDAVRRRLEEGGGDAKEYQIFRFSGNEFLVTLDGFSEEEVRELVTEIGSMRPTVEGVSEGAPLTAESSCMSEAAQIFNQLQAELPPDKRSTGAARANRELVEVVRRRAQFGLEVEKFSSRTKRVLEVMARGDVGRSEEFFRKYMAKMFKGTSLESLEHFEELSAQDEDERSELIDRLALAAARRYFDGQREFKSVQDDIIRTRVRERTAELNAVSSDERLQSDQDPLAAVPVETWGQARVREAREAHEEIGPDADPQTREIAKLRWQVEDARRDRGTGLLDRGSYYEAMERSLDSGEEVSVVFVDMGFLRYFDQKGGAAVGDAALKIAADIMEEALVRAGAEGSVYRYGGDEFTVQVKGGDEAVRRLVREIGLLRDQAGRVPSDARSSEEYEPTKLSFNYGSCDQRLFESVYDDLRKAGCYGEEGLDANKRAELMTVIADRGIEEEKAVDRLQLLIREMRSSRYKSEPLRVRQVESLLAYSEKAVFGRAGEELARRLAADTEIDGAEMLEEIRDFVAGQLEAKRASTEGKDRLMDYLIDLRVQISQLERRIQGLRGETAEQSRIIEKLTSRLERTKAERSQLLGIRRDFDD